MTGPTKELVFAEEGMEWHLTLMRRRCVAARTGQNSEQQSKRVRERGKRRWEQQQQHASKSQQ